MLRYLLAAVAAAALCAPSFGTGPSPAPVNPNSIKFTQGVCPGTSCVTRALALPKGAKATVIETMSAGQRKFALNGQWVQFPANAGAVSSDWIFPITIPPPPPSPACVAGSGHDYQVGPGAGQLATLDLVPWENLAAGDTVRIFYKPTAYKGKFAINAHGTAAAWIDVCGVPGAHGELPVIDADGATTRATMDYGRTSASADNQSRGIVIIVTKGAESGVRQPDYIKVRGLELRNARSTSAFTDANGALQSYADFGGTVFVDAGHNIEITGNHFVNGAQCIFTRSLEGTAAVRSENVHIAENTFDGCGTRSSNGTIHVMYIQTVAPVIEYNKFNAPIAGFDGNTIKDRSVGTVIRYNSLTGGAFGIDLVEAEDYPIYAASDPRYRVAYVYGNIDFGGDLGIHYGGDHPGSEANYRKGTLFAYDNTFVMNGTGAEGIIRLLRVSTTEEHVEFFNNIVWFNPAIALHAWRGKQDVAAGYTAGGIVNLGKNWVNSDWIDSDSGHPIPGQLNGTANLITGTTPPMSLTTLVPSGQAIDGAQVLPPTVAAYLPDRQIDVNVIATPRASAQDLGALEAVARARRGQ
jgi:hypothetical protein